MSLLMDEAACAEVVVVRPVLVADPFESVDTHIDLHIALAQLAPIDLLIITGYYFFDLTHQELAERVGTTAEAVRQRIDRALKLVRQRLIR